MCLCTCGAVNADRRLGKRKNNEIQMTREEGGWERNQEGGGEAIGNGAWRGGQRRRGAGKGKASELAGLFSPNVQGFLMKMSTLLGIFQDPDVDLPLASGSPPPV